MTILGIKVSPDLGEVISHDITIDETSSRKKGSNVNQSTKQSFTPQILYEDGSTEQLDLPDPDVILLMQGIAFLFVFL
jgi:hypothetical protein